ncbi:hypothetical protein AUR64_06760 [Haloprofundus marisrubri]|uniref:Helicase HerA central domain-containing protein n=1 Tax=Haloprofundus marisrubri TaxID=1514971 RepID=A0A0W1RCM5_9EURY|nr:ATP-binding protein [Haloprofundus marisrubri]KTG10879.1 hypothetical protein AUR64_06760 [Haloprofundus marisrubri]
MSGHEPDTENSTNEQALEVLRAGLRGLHDQLEEQAVHNVAQVAYSTDGRTFEYEAPLSFPFPVGSYVLLQSADGQEYLGQITTKETVKQQGAEVDFSIDERQADLFPEGLSITGIRDRLRVLALEGSGVLLGTVSADSISPTTSSDTFRKATVARVDAAVVSRYLSGSSERAKLPVGRALYVDGEATVSLDAGGFARHTFLCGQSGSGKTFSLGIVLEQLLLETDLRILVIDPNSDFVNLNQVRPHEEVNQFRSAPLSEDAYDALKERYQDATASLQVCRPASMATDGDDVLRVRFGDLSRREQATVLGLDPLEDREEFNAFWNTIDDIGRQDYSWDDVRDAVSHDYSAEARQLGMRIENLGLAEWEVWCSRGETSLVDTIAHSDWRCLVLDIGTSGSPSEKMVITNAVLTRLWEERNQRRPTLVVVDEAHNVCPRNPADDLQSISTEAVARIAAEGRKYGLYLLLSTQQPGKIQANTLSQCANLLLMRMNSTPDLTQLGDIFSHVPTSLLEEASKFGLGETVIGGRLVGNPTFAKFEGRLSVEGGGDVSKAWATPHE